MVWLAFAMFERSNIEVVWAGLLDLIYANQLTVTDPHHPPARALEPAPLRPSSRSACVPQLLGYQFTETLLHRRFR